MAFVEKENKSVLAYASVSGKGDCLLRLDYVENTFTILNKDDLRNVWDKQSLFMIRSENVIELVMESVAMPKVTFDVALMSG